MDSYDFNIPITSDAERAMFDQALTYLSRSP
jgi:hypothetical protein